MTPSKAYSDKNFDKKCYRANQSELGNTPTAAHERYLTICESYVRGVNTIKCECVNKMTTIRARRMFIS